MITSSLIDALKKKYPTIDKPFLKNLYFYHLGLGLVYYTYATFNSSDSTGYYYEVSHNIRGETWGSIYGTGTIFIEYFSYPFVRYLGLTYEGMMVLFAFFGFIGWIYLYIFFKEKLYFKHDFYGYDLIKVIFFLPNLHFWSSSLGKGALIFMAIGLFFYGISSLKSRWIPVLISSVIIYHIRPHVMLVVLVSSILGFVFTTRGVSFFVKILFLTVALTSFFFIYQNVLVAVGIKEEELLTEGLGLSHRAVELTKATSGVDIANYSLPFQIFTFLYRPLFIDAPGMLGIIVSFENVFYLMMTIRLFNPRFIQFIITSNFLVKTCLMSFITISVALAQISGNLGLAIRQKSQVMMLFLFVVVCFLDNQKLRAYMDYNFRLSRRNKPPQPVPEVKPAQ
jgi:hypothetical protein